MGKEKYKKGVHKKVKRLQLQQRWIKARQFHKIGNSRLNQYIGN